MARSSDTTLMVRFEGQVDSSLPAATSKVERDLERTGQNVENTSKKHKSGIMGLAAGVGAAAGTMIGGGLMKVVDFAVDSISGAITGAGQLEQSIGAIDTVFKGNADQMNAWSKTAATDVGLTRNEFNELGTLIGTQLRNGGTAMEQLAPKTKDLIGLGADLSSMFGGTSREAVEALSSALKGERDPIEKYGVSLTQAKIDAEAAALGFKKVGGQLSEEAKQAATLSLIMKQTTDAHGNFAKESDTFAGKQQRLSAGWENFTTSLGMMAMPALSGMLDMMNGGLPFLESFSTGLGGIFDILTKGEFNSSLREAFGWEEDSPVVDFLFQVHDGLVQIGDFFTGAGAILIEGDFKGGMFGLEEDSPVVGTLFAIRDGALGIGDQFMKLIDVVRPIVMEVWELLAEKWGEAGPVAEEVFTSLETIVENVMTAIQTGIEIATEVISQIWEDWGPGVLQIIGGLWTAVEGIFRGSFKILEGITDVWAGIFTGDTDQMMTGVNKIFEGAFQTMKGIWEGAVKILGGVWDGIKNTFAAPVNWVITNVLNPLMVKINEVAKLFNLNLNLPTFRPVSGAPGSSGGNSKGSQIKMADGGIMPGYTPGRDVHTFYSSTGGTLELSGGEPVLRPEVGVALGAGWVHGVNAAARAGGVAGARSFLDGHMAFVGGGIVPNATQGFRGYQPAFLSAIQAWAAMAGRMFYMTGNGGARSRADQERAYALYLAGRGPLAARPGTSAHERGLAMDINPWPSAREAALLAQFGLGRTVMPKEPWHIGWLGSSGGGGFDPVGMLKDAIGKVMKVSGAGVLGDILNAVPGRLIDGAAAWLQKQVGRLYGGTASGGGAASGGVQAIVRDAAAKRGWLGAQWDALSWIIGKESSWNPRAQNPSSTAYGLFQFLNGTWASTGIAKTADPALQAEAGMRYIAARYGTPLGAQAFWQRNGWYDNGGWLMPGQTLATNGTGQPEAVLTAGQWDAIRAALTSGSGSGLERLLLQLPELIAGAVRAALDEAMDGARVDLDADQLTDRIAGRIVVASRRV